MATMVLRSQTRTNVTTDFNGVRSCNQCAKSNSLKNRVIARDLVIERSEKQNYRG
jgi:hypothetical protein